MVLGFEGLGFRPRVSGLGCRGLGFLKGVIWRVYRALYGEYIGGIQGI